MSKKFPTHQELRRKAELPKSAKFIGWTVHVPDTEEFLYASNDLKDMSARFFGPDPEKARLYFSPGPAAAIAGDLAYETRVVAVFDLGQQIAVVGDPGETVH